MMHLMRLRLKKDCPIVYIKIGSNFASNLMFCQILTFFKPIFLPSQVMIHHISTHTANYSAYRGSNLKNATASEGGLCSTLGFFNLRIVPADENGVYQICGVHI